MFVSIQWGAMSAVAMMDSSSVITSTPAFTVQKVQHSLSAFHLKFPELNAVLLS